MPNKTTPPSSLDAHIGFWLRFVSNHVSGSFQKLLEEQGVSVTEWVALRTLYDGDITSHSAMIEALGMTKSAASKIVARLEEKGFAERRYANDSAKTQVLMLTEQGKRLVPKLAALADKNDAAYFGDLDDKSRTQLRAVLQTIVRTKNLKKVPIA